MPITPSMSEVLSQALDERAALISVCIPGEVIEWSRTTQRVRVRPVIYKADGTQQTPTSLVPVVFPGVYWDIQIGETGLLIIADHDWRAWWRDNEDSLPETTANHELHNAFFLPGVRTYETKRSVPTNALVVDKPHSTGNVYLGDETANKKVIHEDLLSDLNTFLTALNSWLGLLETWGVPLGMPTTVPLQNTATAITAGIAGGSYESPSVWVES